VVKRVQARDPDLGKLHMEMNIFMNQWGSECSPEEYIYKAVAKAHQEALGKTVEISAMPMASDACELVAHGIPALNYGATGRTRTQSEYQHYGKAQSDWNPKQGEHASITDMVNSTKVYLTLIVDVLSRTREEIGLQPKDAHQH